MRKRERKIETEQRLNGTRTTATLTMTSDDVSARDDKRRREALSTANDAKRSSNGNLVQKCRTTTYPSNGGADLVMNHYYYPYGHIQRLKTPQRSSFMTLFEESHARNMAIYAENVTHTTSK
jgi:hypothetical protein